MDGHDFVAGGGSVTVTLHIIILGFVLGCLTTCLEVPERGPQEECTATSTVDHESRRINNRPSDEQAVILYSYRL